MAVFNYRETASFYDIEVLKYAQADLVAGHIVIDATKITINADPTQRTVIPAGTIMARGGNIAAGKHAPYTGTGTIDGILVRTVDIMASATNSNTPAAVYRFGAIFATPAIVGFTQNATALATALPTCRFE